MATSDENGPRSPEVDAALLALKSQEARVSKLESDAVRATLMKRVTAIASVVALVLSLIVTAMSIYDLVVTKPEADRLSLLARFNDAVNSVAQAQEKMAVGQAGKDDPTIELATRNTLMPEMLISLSTAEAMLRDLRPTDVGIPQLIVLASAAMGIGDFAEAEDFAARAANEPVGGAGVTPYLHAEAERYEGKAWAQAGQLPAGRRFYMAAIETLGTSPALASNRAYDLADLVTVEYQAGDCNDGNADFRQFEAAVRAPQVSLQARQGLVGVMASTLAQVSSCPAPPGLTGMMDRAAR